MLHEPPASLPSTAVVRTLCALAVVAGVGVLGAQQPQLPTFRSGVHVVEVDAVVLDGQGRFVADLEAGEFEVFEDGKRQAIASVQRVTVPVARAELPLFLDRPVVPDVRSNERPFDGRLYLIVLDDLHTAPQRTMHVRRIAREFIEQNVAPNDLAAVVATSGNRRNSQELTSDRQLLQAAVEKFVGQKLISPGLAELSMMRTAETQGADAAAQQRLFNARSTLETLTDLATLASRIRSRRKALVVIGEGIDYGFGQAARTAAAGEDPAASGRGASLPQDANAPRDVRDRLRDLVDAANRGNVTLYAFDPRVYTQGGDDMVDIASGTPEDPAADVVVKSVMLQNDMQVAQDNLRTMASETGGFAVTGSPADVVRGLERVRVESSNYYILGYYPERDRRDGKFHAIEVRVTRPGLRVEARRGYVAPKADTPAPGSAIEAKEGTSAAVRDALGSILPVTGLTLRAAAVPFRGTGRQAAVLVLVQVRGSDLRFTPSGARFEDSVELAAVAIDAAGKTRAGERLKLDLALSARNAEFASGSGVIAHLRLNLPPGRYQLRVAGRAGGTGRVGSVHHDLDVPDFSDPPLAMSGLVLSADEAGQVPQPRPDPQLDGLLPASAITTRAFAASDRLTVLAEVYDNEADKPHSVEISTTIQGGDGRVLRRHADTRSSREIQSRRGAFVHTAAIPLEGLATGIYLLRTEARSTLRPDRIAGRDLLVYVR
ncbi:MAG TPA: VWA domain-containing protein [Vicinamibacterales bacterium]|nr:VWA domain-containing protein [Vicinamibacterales bacterium]